jgi:hypothetical protein
VNCARIAAPDRWQAGLAVTFQNGFFEMGDRPGLCLDLALNAQTNDWTVLERLAPGACISVLTDRRQGCEFLDATDAELSCDRQIGRDSTLLTFVHARVREVRLEEHQHSRKFLGTITGAMIGAAVGASLGYAFSARSSDPETRVYTPLIGFVVGGSIGAVSARESANGLNDAGSRTAPFCIASKLLALRILCLSSDLAACSKPEWLKCSSWYGSAGFLIESQVSDLDYGQQCRYPDVATLLAESGTP